MNKTLSTFEKLLLLPVYFIKLIKSIFPKKLFDFFKSNGFLLKSYKNLIKKTGFTGDLIPWRKQSRAYIEILHLQDKILTHYSDKKSIVVVIDGHNIDLINLSLESLEKSLLKPLAVILFTRGQNIRKLDDLITTNFNIVISSSFFDIDEQLDLLPIYWIIEGDKVHLNTLSCFLSFSENKNLDIIYSDIDFYDKSNERNNPQFFPDWNSDLHLSTSYINSSVFIGNLLSIKAKINNNTLIGDFISKLYCNSLEKPYNDLTISHIPLVLISRNASASKYSLSLLKTKTLNSPLFEVKGGLYGRVLKWTTHSEPLVSLIIPTKNQKDLVKQCIDSIYNKTVYKNFEIILVDNNSDDMSAINYFDHLSKQKKVTLIKYPYEFNYSAINNFAVKHANGDVVGLVNNDIEVIEPNWLSYMVGHVLRPDIGCVGAKLLYENNLIQHGGVVLGYGGGAGHAHKYFGSDSPGYLGRLAVTNQFSAVTAACLLIEKKDFLAVNGLNETEFKVAFNDVDLCLKVLELGRKNIYCAEAVLYHYESISRGLDDTKDKQLRFSGELKSLKNKWNKYIENDPAYNPYLTLKHENFSFKIND